MNVLVKEGILGAILLIVGVFDRLYIDWYWVGRTKVWIIPGTEDLMPCAVAFNPLHRLRINLRRIPFIRIHRRNVEQPSFALQGHGEAFCIR